MAEAQLRPHQRSREYRSVLREYAAADIWWQSGADPARNYKRRRKNSKKQRYFYVANRDFWHLYRLICSNIYYIHFIKVIIKIKPYSFQKLFDIASNKFSILLMFINFHVLFWLRNECQYFAMAEFFHWLRIYFW